MYKTAYMTHGMLFSHSTKQQAYFKLFSPPPRRLSRLEASGVCVPAEDSGLTIATRVKYKKINKSLDFGGELNYLFW